MKLEERVCRVEAAFQKKRELISAEKDRLEKRMCQLEKGKENAAAALCAKVAKVEKPFDDKINLLRKDVRIAERKLFNADWNIRTAGYTVRGRDALRSGKVESEEAFKGILMLHGIGMHDIRMVKTPLENGIIIFNIGFNFRKRSD